ncbi:hypothetical protein DMC30DRAFT_388718 [Rhodotorula diobovata]|uniref:Uncharacterized protein n=1 Tax=Rhodotorula diobovata TaxID=5288 RepID=A0A5C5G5T0_9BASI|nr:hypothetical protein DMC30DRAFT_388718 [Rhodotorula diobovata]
MSLGSLLPAALDAQTLPTLVAALDRSLYPSPTPGLTARMAVLWALTGLCILMAVLYLWLHYRSTTERPRRRCLWFIRLVERPSGRFIVINPRPALTWVVVVYGTYELVFLAAFYRVYALGDRQVAYAGLRGFNALPFFLGGWVLSWSGLQARLSSSTRA